MEQDEPLHLGKRLMAEHGGKDGSGRDGHGAGRERDQGDSAQRDDEQHDQRSEAAVCSEARLLSARVACPAAPDEIQKPPARAWHAG